MITQKKIEGNNNDQFKSAGPFPYMVFDNFWKPEVADLIYNELSGVHWGHIYNNPVESKSTCNNWNEFKPSTYAAFHYLLSTQFSSWIYKVVGMSVIPDYGLHGGGIHYHGDGGKLNPHLDYANHPKMGWERKLNLIIYMTKDYQSGWGGNLGLWTPDQVTNFLPPSVEIEPVFNRAVLFETSDISWHGLSTPIQNGGHRWSMATYYLRRSASPTDRPRALFAPTIDQRDDEEIKEFCKKRSHGI